MGASAVVEQVSVFAEPLSRVLIVRARVGNEAPEMPRVIEPSQMHQLVNQYIVADAVGHQNESPIQADVTGGRAGSPARALIPDAHARHLHTVVFGQEQQAPWKLARRLPAQLPDRLGAVTLAVRGTFAHAGPLALDPGTLLFGEKLGLTAGSPSRNGDTNAAIGPHLDDISPGRRMADEIHETITIVRRHRS
jgi:hypothetical protein